MRSWFIWSRLSFSSISTRSRQTRARIIQSLNGSFQRRSIVVGHEGDAQYNQVLDSVESGLGRSIDFGNQSDREAIGKALIDKLRKAGGCTPLGSRIPRC